ncbi:MAG: ABC transporter permease [Saprospiraceae bacterium]|nr:ABC transporter permease [Saprospiraceae bacterium]
MFKLTLQLALRNLWKQKGYSAINLLGMATGLTCCFLLAIYIRHERQYDLFHANLDRLYRLNYLANFTGSSFELTRVPAPIAPMLPDNFPDIEVAARFFPRSISVRNPQSEQMFEIQQALFADSTATRVFQFDFLQGNAQTALNRPYSIVLTRETAARIFGAAGPVLGKTLLLAGQSIPFIVTGVVQDFPDNAHIHFDFLAPFSNIPDVEPAHAREAVLNALQNNWLASYTHTYVLLKPNTGPSGVNSAFPGFLQRFGNKNFIDKQRFALVPVRDIHLQSKAEDEPEPVANQTYLRLFGVVGLLILLIACINFVNLSNAIYLRRMKEVGVRKVLGAGRAGLVRQFLSETMLLCLMAFVLALVLTHLLLPQLDLLTDRHLSFHWLADWPLSLGFAGIFVLAALLAGAYPSFFASRYQAVEIFKQHTGHTGGRQWLRKTLITIQFVVGIALLSGTLIVLSQLNYWKNQPLGFHKEQILTVPLFSASINSAFSPGDASLRQRMNSLEERVLQNPDVEAITLSSTLPGQGAVRYPVTTDKISLEQNMFLSCMSVDYDFAQTYGLQIRAGRNFGKEYGIDHISSYLINEKAVKALGWASNEEAIGQAISRGGKAGKVVGVVNDFHTRGLQAELEPVVLDISVGSFTTFSIRVSNERLPSTMNFLEQQWKNFFPEKAFDYAFLDENLQNAYADENRLARLAALFAGIAIFLSCFGLFGLISFTVRQKAKEIGIRKVLGASVAGLVGLLSKDYLQLVLLAFVLATPLAWYCMAPWLDNFAYHIQIQWWVFALAGFAALLVALLTIGFQSIRAALANPVNSLHNE